MAEMKWSRFDFVTGPNMQGLKSKIFWQVK
jgi:hypothetical protein